MLTFALTTNPFLDSIPWIDFKVKNLIWSEGDPKKHLFPCLPSWNLKPLFYILSFFVSAIYGEDNFFSIVALHYALLFLNNSCPTSTSGLFITKIFMKFHEIMKFKKNCLEGFHISTLLYFASRFCVFWCSLVFLLHDANGFFNVFFDTHSLFWPF